MGKSGRSAGTPVNAVQEVVGSNPTRAAMKKPKFKVGELVEYYGEVAPIVEIEINYMYKTSSGNYAGWKHENLLSTVTKQPKFNIGDIVVLKRGKVFRKITGIKMGYNYNTSQKEPRYALEGLSDFDLKCESAIKLVMPGI